MEVEKLSLDTMTETEVENTVKVLFTGPSDDELKDKLTDEYTNSRFLPLENELTDASTNFSFTHLQPAINQAQKDELDIVIAFDSNHNKIAVAVRKNLKGSFIILNVHQLSAILTESCMALSTTGDYKILKSINITDMIENIVLRNGSEIINKVIAPGELQQIAGSEKDSSNHIRGFTENQEFYDSQLSLQEIIAEIISIEESQRIQQQTLFDSIVTLYLRYGFYKERSFMVDFVTKEHKHQLVKKIEGIAKDPKMLDERISINKVIDYKNSSSINMMTQKKMKLKDPKAPIIRIEAGRGVTITFVIAEDKIYYYLSLKSQLKSKESYSEDNQILDEQMMKLIKIINEL